MFSKMSNCVIYNNFSFYFSKHFRIYKYVNISFQKWNSNIQLYEHDKQNKDLGSSKCQSLCMYSMCGKECLIQLNVKSVVVALQDENFNKNQTQW